MYFPILSYLNQLTNVSTCRTKVFEYISGAELGKPTGFMDGAFHMAIVDPKNTESASIGEPVDALLWKENDQRKFEAKVAEFGFVANEDEI